MFGAESCRNCSSDRSERNSSLYFFWSWFWLEEPDWDLCMLTFLQVFAVQRSRMSSGLGRGGMTGVSLFVSVSDPCSSGMLSVSQNQTLKTVASTGIRRHTGAQGYRGSSSPSEETSPSLWSSCEARPGGRLSAAGICDCSCGRLPERAAGETCYGCFWHF